MEISANKLENWKRIVVYDLTGVNSKYDCIPGNSETNLEKLLPVIKEFLYSSKHRSYTHKIMVLIFANNIQLKDIIKEKTPFRTALIQIKYLKKNKSNK